jgi:hypothetical protein
MYYVLLQAIAAHPVCHQGNFHLRRLRARHRPMLANWAMRRQQRPNRVLA